MKTDHVPALVMLIAGTVYCLMRIRYVVPLTQFLTQLLIVLIIFWIMGGILKIVFNETIKMADETVEESTENLEEYAEETIENIEAEKLH